MRIQHNIAALNSYRNLSGNNNAVSKNLEKLSSGYRINRAGDDAAGLAISEKMRAQITGLKTAQKNANDGISLVQTAEGALTEVHSMLNRMVELADQSANGTYDNKVDRANLQKEMDSLKSEIDRISEGTNFNGINLLDGSLSGTKAGGGMTGASIANYKASTATITGGNASAAVFTSKDKVVVDGTEIEVDWGVLSTEERAALTKDWGTTPTAADTKKAAEIMQKTINDAIDKYNTQYGASVANITVKAGATAGDFTLTSGQKDGNSLVTIKTNATSVLGLTFGATAADKSTGTPVVTMKNVETDYNGSFTMTIDGEDYAISIAGLSAGDGDAAVVTALNNAIAQTLADYDTAKGNTGDDVVAGKISAKLNANGQLEFTNTSGKKIGFSDKDGGTTAANLGISTEGKNSMNGGLTLQIGDTAADFNQLTVSVGDMSSNSLGIGGISIATQSGAKAAVDKIKSAINSVSSTGGYLGAIHNRLENTINNLGVTTENMTAAESRIRDVDMADEMMSYTKNNILVQASQAMLAQANQLPQGVLQLLQ